MKMKLRDVVLSKYMDFPRITTILDIEIDGNTYPLFIENLIAENILSSTFLQKGHWKRILNEEIIE